MTDSWQPGQIDDGDPRAEAIRSMIEDLGWCLNSYGQIEYLMGDLLWYAWQMPEYSDRAWQVPMMFEKRVRNLEELLKLPGPLAPYCRDIQLLIGRLRELSEPRHMFAHGHCEVVYTPQGDYGMMFRRFLPPDEKKQVHKYEGIVRPNQLHIARLSWTRFASSAQRIIGSLYVDLDLENPDKFRQR